LNNYSKDLLKNSKYYSYQCYYDESNKVKQSKKHHLVQTGGRCKYQFKKWNIKICSSARKIKKQLLGKKNINHHHSCVPYCTQAAIYPTLSLG